MHAVSMQPLQLWPALALLALGFGLKALIDAVWEFAATRPRRATTPRNYFLPCTGCTIRSTSEIGMQVRKLVVRVRGVSNIEHARRSS